MKKIIIACIALLTAASTAFAQTDAKAKAILESVSKKLSSYKTLKAAFSIKSAGSKTLPSQSGTFYLKGVKYHITLPDQEIICDGKTVWTYTRSAKEVQVSNFDPSEQSITPARLLGNFYDKDYSYRYIGEKQNKDYIELTPTNKNKEFAKAELSISKAGAITGGTVYEKNGGKYIYSISNMTPNAAAAETLFSFDAKQHPGVEVVDLR